MEEVAENNTWLDETINEVTDYGKFMAKEGKIKKTKKIKKEGRMAKMAMNRVKVEECIF